MKSTRKVLGHLLLLSAQLLASLTHSLANLARAFHFAHAFVRSFTSELIGRWFMSMNCMFQFHTLSTHSAVVSIQKSFWWGKNSAQRLETVWNRRVHCIDRNLFPMSSRVNERTSERMAQYVTRRFHNNCAYCVASRTRKSLDHGCPPSTSLFFLLSTWGPLPLNAKPDGAPVGTYSQTKKRRRRRRRERRRQKRREEKRKEKETKNERGKFWSSTKKSER